MKRITRRFSRTGQVVLGVIAALVVLRLSLPTIVKWYVNRTLSEIPGYYGRVEDVDLSLWRGAYQIEGLKFMKVNNKIREPYFSAELIDLAVDWKALWEGKIATKIELEKPELTLIKGASEATTQVTVDKKWQEQVQKLYPFEINNLVVRQGKVRFKNATTNPVIDVNLSELDAEASNFTNATHQSGNLFATVKARALVQKTGKLRIDMKVNPFKEPFHADLDGKVEGLDIRELNDFAKAYANFDFEKGHASLYMEFATKDNAFTGYGKFLMEDVDVLDWSNEKGDGFLQKLWEGMIGAGFELLENQGKDRFALRMPLHGKLDSVKVDTWATFWSVLKNAFVKALPKKIENSLNFSTLQKTEKK